MKKSSRKGFLFSIFIIGFFLGSLITIVQSGPILLDPGPGGGGGGSNYYQTLRRWDIYLKNYDTGSEPEDYDFKVYFSMIEKYNPTTEVYLIFYESNMELYRYKETVDAFGLGYNFVTHVYTGGWRYFETTVTKTTEGDLYHYTATGSDWGMYPSGQVMGIEGGICTITGSSLCGGRLRATVNQNTYGPYTNGFGQDDFDYYYYCVFNYYTEEYCTVYLPPGAWFVGGSCVVI
ncbi:MAG: hypothetical protein HZR80_18915 [Candidatus Heimdallarchaeota archaeon]